MADLSIAMWLFTRGYWTEGGLKFGISETSRHRLASERDWILIWLVVDLPLWKYEFVSWAYDIPNIWKYKKCSKPPTSNLFYDILWRLWSCDIMHLQIFLCRPNLRFLTTVFHRYHVGHVRARPLTVFTCMSVSFSSHKKEPMEIQPFLDAEKTRLVNRTVW